MRARVAVYYSGVPVELREVVLKNKPSQLFDASAKGTVPVLVDEDMVIDESLQIMQWALEHNDPQQWLTGVDGDVTSHDLVQECDNDFKPLLDTYKYFDRHPEKTQEQYLQIALPFLTRLNQSLKLNGGGFLARSTFSALDAAIFPFIRQFAHCDLNRFSQLPVPELQNWLAKCILDERFISVMEKYSAWTPEENNSILFGRDLNSAQNKL